MEIYLLKFTACLFIFWVLYIWLLEGQKMHLFKRFYLLGSFVAALIIPILSITHYIEPIAQNLETAPINFPLETSLATPVLEEQSNIDLATVLWLIYGLGALLFSIRFIINLVRLYKSITKSDQIHKGNFIYILLRQYRIPHSFFKYIFLHKTAYQNHEIPKEVVLHEETHAKQLHSLDILLVELLQIVFWFHPLVYVLKHHIKLNHEFLADEAVLNDGVNSSSYQTILLQFSSNTQDVQLSSAINYSSFKKRFTVMKSQTSRTKKWVSSLLLLPIVAILFYSFAERKYVQKENPDTINTIKTELEDAEKLTINYISDDPEIRHYTDQVFYVKNEMTGLNVAKKFNELNDYYKRKWIYVGSTPLSRREIPNSDFDKLKNAEVYLVLIDGQPVDNSELKAYKRKDFATYSSSKISALAEMKQQNLYNLITEEGLRIQLQLAVTQFNMLSEEYGELLTYLDNNYPETTIELINLYEFMQQLYYKIPEEIVNKHNLILPKPISINTLNDELKAYLKKYEAYKRLQDTPPHYINKSSAEKQQMDDLFSDLGGMYFRMKKESKAKVKRPTAPILPYAKITLNGKTYYKKRSELTKEEKETLPPPPPPATKKSKGGPNIEDLQEVYNPSFLEYILEMEQLGASFYLNDELISVEKAKTIAVTNEGECTEMITQKDEEGNYLVKLSKSANNKYARSIEVKILDKNAYLIDGIKATKKNFKKVIESLHQDITTTDRNRLMNIHVSSSKDISNKEVWFIYNNLLDYGFYRIVTPNQIVNRAKGNTPFAIESKTSVQQKSPTEKEMASYNLWAKKMKAKFAKMPESEKINGYPHMINDETFRYYNSIYDRMTSEQKKNSVTLPESVLVTEWPMPENTVVETVSQPIQEKATKQQIVAYNKWAKKINNAVDKAKANNSYEYPIIKKKEVERYLHIYKNLMTEAQRQNAEPFPSIPPPPPPAPETPKPMVEEVKSVKQPKPPAPPKVKATKTKNGKLSEVPPPPPPPSILDSVIYYAKKSIPMYFGGKEITSDEAIALVKSKKVKGLEYKNINGSESVLLTKEAKKHKKRS